MDVPKSPSSAHTWDSLRVENYLDSYYYAQFSKEEDQLPLSAIKTNEKTYQPRNGENKWEQENHVRTLARAIKKDGRLEPIEPIMVVPVAGEYLVIDGHMRRLAYLEAGWPVEKPIPVIVVKGPSADVLKCAIEANSKDKLALTTNQKLQAAWRMVCLNEVHLQQTGKTCFTQREIASVASVSNGAVANLTKDLRQILEKTKLEHALNLNFQEMRSRLREEANSGRDPEAIRNKLVEDFKDRLARAFGKQLNLKADILGEALEAFSESAYAKLLEYMVENNTETVRRLLVMAEADAAGFE